MAVQEQVALSDAEFRTLQALAQRLGLPIDQVATRLFQEGFMKRFRRSRRAASVHLLKRAA